MLMQGDQGGTDCTLVQTTAEWALLGHSGRGLRQWAPEEGSEGGPADTGTASPDSMLVQDGGEAVEEGLVKRFHLESIFLILLNAHSALYNYTTHHWWGPHSTTCCMHSLVVHV